MITHGTVSVIVPVYNTAQFLKRCVHSLLCQTYTQIEIILVDDGSTDGCGAICDSFAKEDARVRVIHQANAGVSAARNAGISAAVGEFIQFCDSDDVVSSDMTQRLVCGMLEHTTDLAICGIKQCFIHKTVSCNLLGESTGVCELSCFYAALAKYHCHEFFGANWNKLYRTSIIRSGCEFLENVCFAEDFLFNLFYFSRMQSVYVVGEALYFYNKTATGSLTKRRPALEASWNDCQRAYDAFAMCFREANCELQYQRDIHHFLLFLLDWTFLRQPFFELCKQRKCVKEMCLQKQIQSAAHDANAYKITVRIFRYALRKHCWCLIYCLRFARMCLGIN